MSTQLDEDISVIRVHQARDSRARAKPVNNHKRISLLDWTIPQEQDLAVWLRLVGCDGLRLSHVHDPVDESASKMLLSCTVTRGIWRFQPLICDDTEHTACSAMSSPYRQGVNSYIFHCHSLFQALRTLRAIIYSLLKSFINTSLIHGEHYFYAPAAGTRDHLKLSHDQRPHGTAFSLAFFTG